MFVVVIGIPLALTAALVGLWVTGNTINIMSLGGLALSIGILVDMAIVTVENTHVQMRDTTFVARAVRRSDAATGTSRMLAMLCILSVFIPAFVMGEPVRSLFMPLTVAVGFAMIAAYLMSSTVVPVFSVWFIRPMAGEHAAKKGFLEKILPAFGKLVSGMIRLRWLVVPAYLIACGLVLWFYGRQVGTELFPQVDSGQFVIRFRSPSGSEYELTRKCALKSLGSDRRRDPREGRHLDGLRGIGGDQYGHQQYPALHARHGRRRTSGAIAGKERRRDRPIARTPAQGIAGEGHSLVEGTFGARGGFAGGGGNARAEVFHRLRTGRHRQHGYEFRLAHAGRDRGRRAGARRGAIASVKVLKEMQQIPILRDVQLYQQLDYPTVRVDIDRQKAGLSGVVVKDVTDALLVGTSSSRYVAKNYWRDPKSGVDYQVQVQVPEQRMNRPQQIETLPLLKVNSEKNMMIRDVANVHLGTAPGEIDRSAMQRYLSITANIEGSDLGRATAPFQRPSRRPANRRGECASASADRLRP